MPPSSIEWTGSPDAAAAARNRPPPLARGGDDSAPVHRRRRTHLLLVAPIPAALALALATAGLGIWRWHGGGEGGVGGGVLLPPLDLPRQMPRSPPPLGGGGGHVRRLGNDDEGGTDAGGGGGGGGGGGEGEGEGAPSSSSSFRRSRASAAAGGEERRRVSCHPDLDRVDSCEDCPSIRLCRDDCVVVGDRCAPRTLENLEESVRAYRSRLEETVRTHQAESARMVRTSKMALEKMKERTKTVRSYRSDLANMTKTVESYRSDLAELEGAVRTYESDLEEMRKRTAVRSSSEGTVEEVYRTARLAVEILTKEEEEAAKARGRNSSSGGGGAAMRWFAASGTLIGATRCRPPGILKWDDDVDLSALGRDGLEVIHSALKADPRLEWRPHPDFMAYQYRRRGGHHRPGWKYDLDVFGLGRDVSSPGEWHIMNTYGNETLAHWRYDHFKDEEVRSTIPCKFWDLTLPCPVGTESYLRRTYGENVDELAYVHRHIKEEGEKSELFNMTSEDLNQHGLYFPAMTRELMDKLMFNDERTGAGLG